jgi:glycosyltransferase involved in cell wall biosynthesis
VLISAVIPCRNESGSIAALVTSLLDMGITQVVVSIDPTSTDDTDLEAHRAGAEVVKSPVSGYDGPVLAGLSQVAEAATHVLFLDAGGKYEMESIALLIRGVDPNQPITYGVRDRNLFWHQRLGNALFAMALRVRFGGDWIADVSSVRLLRADIIPLLALEDRQFSLPFQTTVHALKQNIPISFTPIRCTPTRIGASSVSGSYRNSARAAVQMFLSIYRAPKFPQS